MNGAVRLFRLVPIVLLVAGTTACGSDGPEAPVAGASSSIETADERELVERAESAVDAEAADGQAEFAAAPSTLADDVPEMPRTVAVIGDSIALSAQDDVTGALESLDLDVVAYDAWEGRRMVNGDSSLPSGLTAIDELVADGVDPDLWVVALGTNDVGAVAVDSWRADIDAVLRALPAGDDVIWVDTWAESYDDYATDFNELLRDELRFCADCSVLDWHTAAAGDGLIIDDGVHLTDTGRIAFARLIGDGVRTAYDDQLS